MAPRTDTRTRQNQALTSALSRLPQMERDVLRLRAGLADGHATARADVARKLNLSLAEVDDIEQRAYDRLRRVLPLDRLRRLLPDG